MSHRIPTLKVADDNPRGWKIINASAFDPDRHEIWTDEDNGPEGPIHDRDALKARAAELGLRFGPRMSSEKLADLVAEAEAKAPDEAKIKAEMEAKAKADVKAAAESEGGKDDDTPQSDGASETTDEDAD